MEYLDRAIGGEEESKVDLKGSLFRGPRGNWIPGGEVKGRDEGQGTFAHEV